MLVAVVVGLDVGVLSLLHEPALGAVLHPALDGLDLRADAVGRRAVERLLGRVRGPGDATPTRLVVEPVLIPGLSIGEAGVAP